MTKQSIAQTVAAVQNAPGSMYTREDIISLLNRIEAPESKGLTKAQIAYLINLICDTVSNNASNLDTRDVCDIDSAEFELYRNEISLTSVDVDADKIASTVVVGIDDVIETFFKGLENEVKG